jgi:VIT1/CCC1 family predicted Fe2+/Mn2+ transporter
MFWTTFLLGVALVLAPFVLGYSSHQEATWSSVLLGAALGFVSGYQIRRGIPPRRAYFVIGLVGVLTLIAPFVLGFNLVAAPAWTAVIVGNVAFWLVAYQLVIRPPSSGTNRRY